MGSTLRLHGSAPRVELLLLAAKWRLSGVPTGRQYQVIRAQITVVQTAPPGYTRAEGEQLPLEARPLSHTNFTEQSWNYDAPSNPEVGATTGADAVPCCNRLPRSGRCHGRRLYRQR